jgi:hypothetical protein
LRLSIFWNSPVFDNSPTSCSSNHILSIFRSLRFVTSLFRFWHTSYGLRVRIKKKMFLVYFKQKKLLPHQVVMLASIDNSDVSDLYSKNSTDTESYLSSDIESDWNIYTLCWFNNNYRKTILSKLRSAYGTNTFNIQQ